MPQFVGIIHKEKNSDYGVSFPDFPGCVTAGVTMQDAYEMAAEALQAHIDVMAEYGDAFPEKPLTLDEAKKQPLNKNSQAFFMVEAQLPSKPKRINIMLDESLISRIDAIANNRSAFLAEAAIQKLRDQSSV